MSVHQELVNREIDRYVEIERKTLTNQPSKEDAVVAEVIRQVDSKPSSNAFDHVSCFVTRVVGFIVIYSNTTKTVVKLHITEKVIIFGLPQFIFKIRACFFL